AKCPTHTFPNPPWLAMTRLSRGRGAMPDTPTSCGEAGSLLTMRIVAALAPGDVGANRIATSIESPTSSLSGYDRTPGASKSAVDELMLLISSCPVPLLLIVSTSSVKEPAQHSPNVPWSA